MNKTHTNTSAFLVRWELAQADKHVMCGIQRKASLYEVSTVPLWAIGKSAVETFSCATAALRRHAEIAANLREAGWTVAAYTS
jgi:phage head maturation protease